MYVSRKHFKTHLKNEFESLLRFRGEKLRYIGGLKLYAEPESIKFLDDCGHTILIEMEFLEDRCNGINPEPRYVRYAIPKAALAVGSVQLICASTGEPLHGSTVAPYMISDEEAFIPNGMNVRGYYI